MKRSKGEHSETLKHIPTVRAAPETMFHSSYLPSLLRHGERARFTALLHASVNLLAFLHISADFFHSKYTFNSWLQTAGNPSLLPREVNRHQNPAAPHFSTISWDISTEFHWSTERWLRTPRGSSVCQSVQSMAHAAAGVMRYGSRYGLSLTANNQMKWSLSQTTLRRLELSTRYAANALMYCVTAQCWYCGSASVVRWSDVMVGNYTYM